MIEVQIINNIFKMKGQHQKSSKKAEQGSNTIREEQYNSLSSYMRVNYWQGFVIMHLVLYIADEQEVSGSGKFGGVGPSVWWRNVLDGHATYCRNNCLKL